MADKLLEYSMNFEYLATLEKNSRILQKVYGGGTISRTQVSVRDEACKNERCYR
jgi:hypothetical protein